LHHNRIHLRVFGQSTLEEFDLEGIQGFKELIEGKRESRIIEAALGANGARDVIKASFLAEPFFFLSKPVAITASFPVGNVLLEDLRNTMFSQAIDNLSERDFVIELLGDHVTEFRGQLCDLAGSRPFVGWEQKRICWRWLNRGGCAEVRVESVCHSPNQGLGCCAKLRV
jgi:hypothetical protein